MLKYLSSSNVLINLQRHSKIIRMRTSNNNVLFALHTYVRMSKFIIRISISCITHCLCHLSYCMGSYILVMCVIQNRDINDGDMV